MKLWKVKFLIRLADDSRWHCAALNNILWNSQTGSESGWMVQNCLLSLSGKAWCVLLPHACSWIGNVWFSWRERRLRAGFYRVKVEKCSHELWSQTDATGAFCRLIPLVVLFLKASGSNRPPPCFQMSHYILALLWVMLWNSRFLCTVSDSSYVVFAVGAQKRRCGYSTPQTLALGDSDVTQRLGVPSD